MGRALIAPLRIGLQDAGVPVLLNTALTDLYYEDGVVRGVYVRDMTGPEAADPTLIRVRRGVILGSGGFEHNEQMRVKYQRGPITTDWTVGAKANTGDGIAAAEKLGAALELMEDAWWGPTVPLEGAPWFALSERNSPGSIIVNMSGQRFMNESMPYVEACHRMYGGEYGQGDGPGENIPAWLVFDQQYRDRFIFAGLQPGQRIPKKWLESGVIVKADTLEELATITGLPTQAFADTVKRFNGFARSGVDEDFHRGESAYDRYYGDPRNKPNPNLGELTHPPYYAAKMVPGDLGTKGGIRTDVHGRALRDDGSVIEGLYAAGNVSSPVMGHTYPGPGGTIGPAMTFGYLAALHLAGVSEPAGSGARSN
jgi:3-oxosteroid 1-dehydrogenase